MTIKEPNREAHFLPNAILVTVIGIHSAYAAAQSAGLEEVIVTATKRTESLQDVAMSVSAFSEQTIQQANINNADDLAILAPSLTITTNTQPNTAAFRIRGIGTSQTDIALEPSVGIFVDDVYLNRSGLGMADLTDIERIEILNGPQGTLYGKNTNAGAISIITKAPNLDEYEAYLESTLGDYGLQKHVAVASGPMTDNLAFRLSGSIHERDGYLENNGTGDDMNGTDDWNVVGKLIYVPIEDLSISFKGTYVDRNPSCCAPDAIAGESVNEQLVAEGLQPDKNDPFDYETAVSIEQGFESEFYSFELVADYEREWGSFKSITAYSDNKSGVSFDPDRSQLDVMSYVDAYGEGDTFSQEFRVAFDANDKFQHMLGFFYYESTTQGGNGIPFVFLGEDFLIQGNQQEDFLATLPAPLSFLAQPGDNLRAESSIDTTNVAIFGQSTWSITNAWQVTGGLRWTDEEKNADLFTEINSTAPSQALTGQSFLSSISTPIDESFTRSTDDINWLITTSYDALDDTMLYATVATGSKSGGFNTVNGTAEEREFEDEETISYEAGIKSTLLESRLRINAAIFYTEISEYQFQQQLETGIGTRVSNEAEVETQGLDLEIQALPLQNLTLGASLLYMDKYEITSGPNEGDDLPYTAEYSYSLNATFFLPLADGAIYMRTDYSYMDDHANSASGNLRDDQFDDREDLNAKLGWRNENWNISVWGKNLTDDEYVSFTATTFPVTSTDAFWLAPPRTWGATARYDF
ncbi:MAG: TonB-dependent receptor [Gammaproteobacteria bacterium]|nr:TonB-dependent receptor [Gammaproteobacteria bacterium]